MTDASQERDRYLDHLLSTLPGSGDGAPLAGWRVVVDCAHGAAYDIAPRMLRRAGAEVIAIGAEPDGENINAGCGSTSLGALKAAVAEHGADVGIARTTAQTAFAIRSAARDQRGGQQQGHGAGQMRWAPHDPWT